jgi:hypothetical protein
MTRTPGLRGLLPAKHTDLPQLHTLAVEGTVPPPSADETHGFSAWLMLGNGPDPTLTVNDGQPVGDCFFAAVCHLLMLKALVEVGGKWVINPTVADEIQATANHWVGLYLGYQNGLAPGQTATSGPDNGTVLLDGLTWLQKAAYIKRFGPVNFKSRTAMNEATVTHKGVLVGVSLDEDAEQEFAEHQEWQEYPESVDPIVGGHAIDRVAYTPTSETFLTWGADQKASAAWEKGQVTEAYWLQAPWEPDAAGYDYAPLDAALAAA